jgi:Skp family chaperone for outer membrane proteins
MKQISILSLCIVLLSSSGPAYAIELSLEENRAERGSVGFVDMKRLFVASPDAARAREGLEELVRQAEERVNTKKAEVLRLRQEVGALKIAREELAKSTPTATAPPSAPVNPLLPVPSAKPLAPTPATKDPVPPLTINLPGLTDGPLNLERPGGSPLNPTPAANTAPAVAVSTVPPPAAVPAEPTLAQRLLELDGRITARQGDVDRLQADLDGERLGAEKSLLDAEGRKADQVLARLYRAISEVARREGVSVVVDKSATLYGHPAVDLTEKILKQLRGVVPPQ